MELRKGGRASTSLFKGSRDYTQDDSNNNNQADVSVIVYYIYVCHICQKKLIDIFIYLYTIQESKYYLWYMVYLYVIIANIYYCYDLRYAVLCACIYVACTCWSMSPPRRPLNSTTSIQYVHKSWVRGAGAERVVYTTLYKL